MIDLEKIVKTVKAISLFFIAPFISLLYAAFFPVVATALICIIGVDALVKKLESTGAAKDFYKEIHGAINR